MNFCKALTPNVRKRILNLSGVLGVVVAWATAYFFEDWMSPVFWLLMCVAIVLGYGGAWGGLSSQWGADPFDQDPLGWRDAKRTYLDSKSGPT